MHDVRIENTQSVRYRIRKKETFNSHIYSLENNSWAHTERHDYKSHYKTAHDAQCILNNNVSQRLSILRLGNYRKSVRSWQRLSMQLNFFSARSHQRCKPLIVDQLAKCRCVTGMSMRNKTERKKKGKKKKREKKEGKKLQRQSRECVSRLSEDTDFTRDTLMPWASESCTFISPRINLHRVTPLVSSII